MKPNNKIRRYLFTFLVVILIGLGSNCIVLNSTVGSYKIFETVNLFTYFGILIGFAITIYTFGLSMVTDIKNDIQSLKSIEQSLKTQMYNKLVSAFLEIKQDIWLIFFALILVIYFAIAKDITNPFNWEVEKYKIPETVNITLFVTSTFSMYDIMKTLFNLAEIKLELINKNGTTGS